MYARLCFGRIIHLRVLCEGDIALCPHVSGITGITEHQCFRVLFVQTSVRRGAAFVIMPFSGFIFLAGVPNRQIPSILLVNTGEIRMLLFEAQFRNTDVVRGRYPGSNKSSNVVRESISIVWSLR